MRIWIEQKILFICISFNIENEKMNVTTGVMYIETINSDYFINFLFPFSSLLSHLLDMWISISFASGSFYSFFFCCSSCKWIVCKQWSILCAYFLKIEENAKNEIQTNFFHFNYFLPLNSFHMTTTHLSWNKGKRRRKKCSQIKWNGRISRTK